MGDLKVSDVFLDRWRKQNQYNEGETILVSWQKGVKHARFGSFSNMLTENEIKEQLRKTQKEVKPTIAGLQCLPIVLDTLNNWVRCRFKNDKKKKSRFRHKETV